MGHVIAGAAIGRDLALYGADVLNVWRSNDCEIEAFAWDVQVGMRSTLLDDSREDRATFDHLLQERRCLFCQQAPGIPAQARPYGRGVECAAAGLVHVMCCVAGGERPLVEPSRVRRDWSDRCRPLRPRGIARRPRHPPIIPICDNVVGWLGTVGVLAALRRRAVEGGSYRVVVGLTRTVLWQLALGIFDKRYARETAGSKQEHSSVAPGPVHRRDAPGNLSGHDRSGDPVAHTRRLSDRSWFRVGRANPNGSDRRGRQMTR